jgi:hypothetical protein
MMKIAGSGSASGTGSRSESGMNGSGSTPKCHGSVTLHGTYLSVVKGSSSPSTRSVSRCCQGSISVLIMLQHNIRVKQISGSFLAKGEYKYKEVLEKVQELGLYNVGREETSGRHGADLQNGSDWARTW